MDGAAVDRFEAGRTRLASLAYRLLGSATDAEDAVQDAFLRWQAADRDLIEVPEAWLTKVVTNVCLDRLRSAQARRERAVGAWMPEPLLAGDPMLGPADTAEQRESVSLAVLTLMERLTPAERAVYVLREAFAHSHTEIAEILDITESASQQHLHRARRHLATGRRGDAVDGAEARRIVEAFLDAAASGRVERLVALLTEDATGVSDGAGGNARLLRLAGPERIAASARGALRPSPGKRQRAGGPVSLYAAVVNGSPALIAAVGGRAAGTAVLDMREGRIAAVHGVASPERLRRLNRVWAGQEHGLPLIEAW